MEYASQRQLLEKGHKIGMNFLYLRESEARGVIREVLLGRERPGADLAGVLGQGMDAF